MSAPFSHTPMVKLDTAEEALPMLLLISLSGQVAGDG